MGRAVESRKTGGDTLSKVRACFEVANMAIDENGHPAPAGLQICMGESVKEWPYEDLIANVDINKVAALVHRDPRDITIITPQEYDERYGDKE